MNRKELTKAIAGIYSQAHDELKASLLGGGLNNVAHAIGQAAKLTSARFDAIDKRADDVDTALVEHVSAELKSLMDKVTSSIPATESSKLLHERLAGDYVSTVSAFMQSGGTGFYDIGAVISVMYDKDVKPLLSDLYALQVSNDIHVFDVTVNGNPGMCEFLKSARIGVVLPSSLLAEFDAMIARHVNSEAIFETQKYVKCQRYFITPMLNDFAGNNADPIAFLKSVLRSNRQDEDRSWLVEDAFTALGCSRIEFYQHDTVTDMVMKSLTLITLYSVHEREHMNGVMPSAYCYDSEIEKYDLNVSGFKKCDDGEYSKSVNVVDELKIYAIENPS